MMKKPGEPTVENISPLECLYIDFTGDLFAMSRETDQYKIVKTKTGMIYKRDGFDNGINISYEFENNNKFMVFGIIRDLSN